AGAGRGGHTGGPAGNRVPRGSGAGGGRVSRRAPRPAAIAIERLAESLAPATPLAAVQAVWERVVGSAVASQAAPVALRDGNLTVVCRASVWAQELELMGPELVARVNAELASEAVVRVRCKATPR